MKPRKVISIFIAMFVFCSVAFNSSCKKAAESERDIILVLDTSRSMIGQGGKNIFPQVKDSLKKFVDDIKTGDTLTIVRFDEKVEALPTIAIRDNNDKEIVNSMLATTKAEGMWTYTMEMLRNVFKLAEEMEKKNPNRKQVIVLLTDGLDDPPPSKRKDRFNIKEAAKDYVGKEWYVYLVNFGDMKKNERFKEVQAELQRTMTKHVELVEGGKSPGGAVAEVQQTIEQERQRDRIFSLRTLIIVLAVILLLVLIILLISIISKIKVKGALEYYNYKLLDPYINVVNLGRFGRKEVVIGRTGGDVNLRDFEGRKPFVVKAARVKGKVVNRLIVPEGLTAEFVNRESGEYLNDGDIFKVANYSFKFMAPQE